jgi:hypothetical protein
LAQDTCFADLSAIRIRNHSSLYRSLAEVCVCSLIRRSLASMIARTHESRRCVIGGCRAIVQYDTRHEEARRQEGRSNTMAHTRQAYHRREAPHTRLANRRLAAQPVRPGEHSTPGQCSMMPWEELGWQTLRAGPPTVSVRAKGSTFRGTTSSRPSPES